MNMPVCQFGNSPYAVPAIGLGGMPLSIDGRPSETQALAVIERALTLGLRFIDTADVYCLNETDIGHNERLIAKALKRITRPSDLVVATKGGLLRPRGEWVVHATPQHLREACEASLRALEVDCIQLYQLHAPDPNVPFESSVEALAKLQTEGKIQHVGLSNISLEQLKQAMRIVPICSVQNRANVHYLRSLKAGIVDYCTEHRIAFIAFNPVGGRHGQQDVIRDPNLSQIAEKYQASNHQIALAWLLSKSPQMLAIPGASRLSSVESSAAVLNLRLDKEDLKFLDQAFG